MSIWFYIIICIIISIVVFIITKLIFIKKSIQEITIQLASILKSDTNNLLTISSSDKDVKKLGSSLNIELKELREQRLKYENGNQELKKAITNISHDLRTPLTAISGYIELINNENEKDKQEEYLKIIERKTNDLILLTEQLFHFSNTVDIDTKIEKHTYCINELLEETLADYYIIFKENNIVPNVNITEEKIYKNVDKNTIIRVFENILSNVIKYSNGDFNVELSRNGKIIFSNKATFLDAITVQKIFDRYFTVENAKKSSGLGLSIANQLVKLNNGTISAKYLNEEFIIEILL